MREIMTLAEINKRFKSEWVLLEDPELSDSLEIRGGRVLSHSKDQAEIYRKARELKPKHSAIVYAGSLSPDMVVVLWTFDSILPKD